MADVPLDGGLFDEVLIDRLPFGVVVLDRHGIVVRYNRYEEQLARRRREDVIGRHFFHDVARCTDVPAISGRFEAHVATNTLSAEVEHAFALPFLPRPRDVRLILQSFEAGGEPYAAIVIEDISFRKAAERERERMMSLLVHDLANPLAGLLGYAQMARSEQHELPPDELADLLARIEEGATRMTALLRSTARELSGEQAAQAPVNLHAVVLSVLGLLLPVARSRGIELHYDGRVEGVTFPERAVRVTGHVERLSSVVENLLSNAIKYATREVRVELAVVGDRVRLDVIDDGRGIPAEAQPRIFGERYQAPGSLPGHGLGLFGARRTVVEHGGELTFTSSGAGTRFRVELPG